MSTGRWIPKTSIRSLVIALAILLAVPPFPLPRAQQPPPPPQGAPPQAPPPQAQSAAQAPADQGEAPTDAPPFKPEELEQIVAPIALYPDALVAQTMMAATYPLEVIQAARLMKANPNLKDAALNDELKKYDWDDSVKSLFSFPQILGLLNDKIDWMQKLGDAFLGQRKDTMDAIQRLRAKAQAQGNLKSTEQQKVIVEHVPADAAAARAAGPGGAAGPADHHQDRAGESAGGLRAELQPDRGVRGLAVSGLSALLPVSARVRGAPQRCRSASVWPSAPRCGAIATGAAATSTST